MELVITSGEPAGIGPDICLMVFSEKIGKEIASKNKITVLGNQEVFRERAQMLNIDFNKFSENINFFDLPILENVTVGKPTPINAIHVLLQLDIAIGGCSNGMFDAMVTSPLQKSNIIKANIVDNFQGHTEYLAKKTQAKQAVMMLAEKNIKVVPLTIHIPLSQVAANINQQLIINTLTIIECELISKYKISQPTIAVLGINPHAGEDGKIGDEEINIIMPAIKKFQQNSQATIIAPLSADTAFLESTRNKVDVYLGMYHDQVLPVFKTLTFGGGVNVTLGLPIIRTSVDHGTALAIAGSGKANPQGLISAINEAIFLAS